MDKKSPKENKVVGNEPIVLVPEDSAIVQQIYYNSFLENSSDPKRLWKSYVKFARSPAPTKNDSATNSDNSTEKLPPMEWRPRNGDPLTFAAMQARIDEDVGQHCPVYMPAFVYLHGRFGERFSREADLTDIAELCADVQFCKVHFYDVDNFLGALEHSKIQLEEFLAILSPCAHLKLNGRPPLVKRFLHSDYVLKTRRMVIYNLEESTNSSSKAWEFEPDWLLNWLLFPGKNVEGGNEIEGNSVRKLKLKGGRMEIAKQLVEMVIERYAQGDLDGANFVLTLKNFALDSSNEFEEFNKDGKFWLKKLGPSIWELGHGQSGGMMEEEEKKEEVQAIFEIDKYQY